MQQVINFCHSTINAFWGSLLHRNLRTTEGFFWRKGENHYFQIYPQPYFRILKRQHAWAQHVFRTRASWNTEILSALLCYWVHYKKTKPDCDACMPVKKEPECQGKKHKIHDERKKAAHTLSKPERKEKENTVYWTSVSEDQCKF